MKGKTTSLLLALVMALLPILNVSAQEPELTDEEKIIQYRDDIRRMAENAPAAGAPEEDSFRGAMASLRDKLRELLTEKKGALKSKIQNLRTPRATPEVLAHVARLEEELRSVTDEAETLRGGPQPNPQAAGVPPRAAPAQTPAPAVAAAERSFEAAANSFTTDQLREAAAPPEVADSELPEPDCTAAGMPASRTRSRLDLAICRMANDVSSARTSKVILISRDQANLFSILIAKLLKTRGDESYVAFITEAEEARTDQQVGASSTGPGTTSLVTKGGVPFALGLAVENGAAVETRKDTTVTFRVNPVGAFNLLSNNGFIPGFQQSETDPLLKFLRKTSVGLTFDTSRGDEPGVFTGDRQQLAAFSVRYEFVNQRDPRLKRYEREWEQFVADEGVALAQKVWATTLDTIQFTDNSPMRFKDPALQAWLDQTNQEISGLDQNLSLAEMTSAVAQVIRRQAELLPVDLVSDETVEAINGFAAQFVKYSQKKKELLDTIAKGKVFTFEYLNRREVNAPDTSNFNFIAATGPGRRIDLTANGSFTIFNTRPAPLSPDGPRPGRVRDFQFAGQVDVPFGGVEETGQFVFWFSGKYERLMEDATTQLGTVVPNTKGDIAVGQFGLRIPIKGLGMKFPISFTFANRTELVKEKEVRGNFGFTFNLDTLFSKFKPF